MARSGFKLPLLPIAITDEYINQKPMVKMSVKTTLLPKDPPRRLGEKTAASGNSEKITQITDK